MPLSAAQRKQVRDALLSAFKRPDLEHLVGYLGWDRLEIITSQGTLEHEVFELANWARHRGLLKELIAAALNERPKKQELQQLASDSSTWTFDPPLPPASPDSLEYHLGQLDEVLDYLEELSTIEPINRPHLPSDRTRTEEVERIVKALQAADTRGVVLWGSINSGKTVLARRVLHQRGEIKAHFGSRRFEVDLTPDATEFHHLVKLILKQYERHYSGVAVEVDRIHVTHLADALKRLMGSAPSIILLRNVLAEHQPHVRTLLDLVRSLTVLLTTPEPLTAHQCEALGLTQMEVGALSDEDAVALLKIELKLDAASSGDGAGDAKQQATLYKVARLLGKHAKLLKLAAIYYDVHRPALNDLPAELEQVIPQITEKAFAAEEIKIIDAISRRLSAGQKTTLGQLAVYAPAPATFEALPHQKGLTLAGVVTVEAAHRNRCSIDRAYQDLARQFLEPHELFAAQQAHAERFAAFVHAAYARCRQGAFDYTEFEQEWPNIKIGWQWTLDQIKVQPNSEHLRRLLVHYAESIPYFDPFSGNPQETVARIQAALAQPTFDASQIPVAPVWISLACAYIEAQDVAGAYEQLNILANYFGKPSLERCAILVASGDLHSLSLRGREDYYRPKLATAYYMIGQQLAQQYKQPFYEYRALFGHACLCVVQGYPHKAIGFYIRALRCAAASGDMNWQIKIAHQLGVTIEKYAGSAASPDYQAKAEQMKDLARRCKQFVESEGLSNTIAQLHRD